MVTVGNRIYVLVGISDPAGSWTCIDSLGNNYSIVYEKNTPAGSGSNQKLVLMSAPVTVGGTLTSIQVDWTTVVTGISMCSAEFTTKAVAADGFAEAANGAAQTSGPVSVGSIGPGLLLYCITMFGQVGAFTPPAGWSLADSATVADNSGWQSFMCYRDGTATGTVSASWATGRGWHAATSFGRQELILDEFEPVI